MHAYFLRGCQATLESSGKVEIMSLQKVNLTSTLSSSVFVVVVVADTVHPPSMSLFCLSVCLSSLISHLFHLLCPPYQNNVLFN